MFENVAMLHEVVLHLSKLHLHMTLFVMINVSMFAFASTIAIETASEIVNHCNSNGLTRLQKQLMKMFMFQFWHVDPQELVRYRSNFVSAGLAECPIQSKLSSIDTLMP